MNGVLFVVNHTSDVVLLVLVAMVVELGLIERDGGGRRFFSQ